VTEAKRSIEARSRAGVLRRLSRRPLPMAALIVLGLIVLVSIFAPVLAPYDPQYTSLEWVFAPWSPEHLLGGDSSGRDVLSRLLYGGRITLAAGALAIAVTLVIGVPLGLLAGYFGRWVDSASSWISDVVMSVPAIVALFAVAPVFGSGFVPTMTMVGIILFPGVFRLTRSAARQVRRELYVDAAQVNGLGDLRIVARHVLPVIGGQIVVQATLTFGVAVTLQAGLDFLGLGDPTVVSWGMMLSSAFASMSIAPSLVIAPGVAVGATAAAAALLGSGIADVLGERGRIVAPKARRRHPQETSDDATEPQAAPEPAADVLQVRDLRVSYPTPAGPRMVVRGVSFALRRGEALGLVGESGSGKTQTSFAVLGLLPPEAQVTAAHMLLGESELSTLPERELRLVRGSRIAYIPQEPMSSLDPAFTVGFQLQAGMRAHLSLDRAGRRERARELLDRVGIRDVDTVMKRYPHQISGGMAQRVLIAAAVSCDPEFLIADEPTTALDVTVQAEVLSLIRGLQKEMGLGVLLVTHNLGVVADICDRVAVMHDGVIVEDRPVAALFAHPDHPYTKRLLGSTLDDSTPRQWNEGVRS